MKRNYIVSIALVLGFASCNYLDVTPPGKVIPDKVSEFRALMTSAYNTFPVYKNLLSVRSDELQLSSDDEFTRDKYLDIYTWNDGNPDSKTLSYPWENMYKTIFYVNSVIENVMDAQDDVHSDEDAREQLLAEALLLRAYCHFELLNLYAKPYHAATAMNDRGIPLALKIDVEQKFIPSTTEEVYRQIFSDLDEGLRLIKVKEQEVSVRYRFSEKAAKALQARIRLYREEWALALEAAESILPECKLTDLAEPDAVSPWNYNSVENMLALDPIGNRDLSYLSGSTDFVGKYQQGEDLRREATFDKESDAPVKTADENKVKVTFRSAEVYLIAAEAAAHLDGKLEIAKSYLKALLQKRLTVSYYSRRVGEIDGMGQQELLTEIFEERARELALEGHRWYDLRRTSRPRIVKAYTDRSGNEQEAVLLQDDPRYTISFPQEAVQNNPDLAN